MFISNAYKNFKVMDFIFRWNVLQCNFWTVRIASPSPLSPFYPVRSQFGTPSINNQSRDIDLIFHGEPWDRARCDMKCLLSEYWYRHFISFKLKSAKSSSNNDKNLKNWLFRNIPPKTYPYQQESFFISFHWMLSNYPSSQDTKSRHEFHFPLAERHY